MRLFIFFLLIWRRKGGEAAHKLVSNNSSDSFDIPGSFAVQERECRSNRFTFFGSGCIGEINIRGNLHFRLSANLRFAEHIDFVPIGAAVSYQNGRKISDNAGGLTKFALSFPR
jgi:hypothetical protein